MASDVHVRVLRTIPEVEELRTAWETWPGHRDSEIDFYLTVVGFNPDTVRPHVLVVYRHGQPDAILVGRLDHIRLDFRVGYVHFRPGACTLYFVYGALRGNSSVENSELFLNEISQCLSRGEADAAYLNFIATDSHIYKIATEMPGFLSRDHIRAIQPHFSSTIPATLDEFYRARSPKVRKNQKWQAKRLVKDFSGAINIRCFRKVTEIGNLIQDVEEIARKSYQRGLGVGFFDTEETRERLRLEARKGWLRGYVLYVVDRPSAFWIGDLNRGTFYSAYLGYDPDLGKYSPGMFLIMKAIESFCKRDQDKVSEVDFAPGYAQYKQVLGQREWHEASVYLFARSLKGLELNLLRFLTGVTDQALKTTLGRTALLQRVKKIWRAHKQRGQTRTCGVSKTL